MQNKPIDEYTSAHRLQDALAHREPRGIPLDIGATKVTGIHIKAYRRLMEAVFPGTPKDIDLAHFTQQLAQPEERLLQALGVDVAGVFSLAPEGSSSVGFQGQYHTYKDEWDIGWRMPREGGLYYDMFTHPLAGGKSPVDDYPWPNGAHPHRFADFSKQLERAKGGKKGIVLGGVCAGILEMSLWLRGFEEFFMDLALDPGAACAIMDKVLDIKLAYWDIALDKAGEHVLVAQEADDLGTQTSSLISPDMYRKLVKPRHKKLFEFIKKKTGGKVQVFLHSCGNIVDFIPDLIDAGVDILNPIQSTVPEMAPHRLKRAFGDVLTLWGGAVDTQKVLPYGSPQEVKDDVRRRIDAMAPGGGFVFATVHNIQADVGPENILAMIEALNEYR